MSKQIGIFLGASPDTDPRYAEAARALGVSLAARGHHLVFGGTLAGLMQVVCDPFLQAGSQVTGVILEMFLREDADYSAFRELIRADTLQQRKQIMMDRADAFLVLPGGYGTLDELFSVLAAGQLGFHDKPCGLLNTAGYYDGLLAFLDGCVESGFLRAEHRRMLRVGDTPEGLLEAMGL